MKLTLQQDCPMSIFNFVRNGLLLNIRRSSTYSFRRNRARNLKLFTTQGLHDLEFLTTLFLRSLIYLKYCTKASTDKF
jgi:hypothetical protein